MDSTGGRAQARLIAAQAAEKARLYRLRADERERALRRAQLAADDSCDRVLVMLDGLAGEAASR